MFRLSRLINAIANPNDIQSQRDADYELQNVERGDAFGGYVVPKAVATELTPARSSVRNFDTSTASGGNLVPTNIRGDDFIESLMADTFALSRATVYSGLSGKVEIPAENVIETAGWVAETGTPTESAGTIRQVTLTPKKLGVFTEVSRALLVMGIPDVEELVKRLLIRSVATALDKAILYGTGANNQPKGMNASVTGKNAATIVTETNQSKGKNLYTGFCAMESQLATANVDENAIEALISPKTYYKARFQSYLGDGDNTTLDPRYAILPTQDAPLLEQYPQAKSAQVTAGQAFLADFSQVIVGQWADGFEVGVNPYAKDTAGLVRIQIETLADVQFKHVKSFAQLKES